MGADAGSGTGACACRPLRQASPRRPRRRRQAAAVRRPRVRPVLYRRAGDHGDLSDHRSTDQRRTDHDHPHLPAGRVVRDGAQPHPGGRRAGRHGRPRRRGRRAGARGRRRRGRAVGHLHARRRPRGRRPHRRGRRPADARPRSDAPGRGAAPRPGHRDPAAGRRGAGDRVGRRPGARGTAVARRPARAVDGDARRVRHAARPGRRPAARRGGGAAAASARDRRRCRATRPVPSASTTSCGPCSTPPAPAGSATRSRRRAGATSGSGCARPTQVLDERVGTCLDTTLALAAVLEQCGIRPLVWMVQGHAFLGYWREETSLANIVLTDASPVVNLIDLGAIRLVETTMLDLHRPGARRRRRAPLGVLALAGRRPRRGPRRDRRVDGAAQRRAPAAGPRPHAVRRRAGGHLPGGRAQHRAARRRRRPAARPRRPPRRCRRGWRGGRTPCSTSACATG